VPFASIALGSSSTRSDFTSPGRFMATSIGWFFGGRVFSAKKAPRSSKSA